MALLFTLCARFATWRRLGVLLALLALLVPGTGRSAMQVAPHAQPALLALAVQHPRATVRVIVERTRHATGTEALVARLGGRVTTQLPLINAFAAALPAHAVPEVARASGVRWVTPDGPMVTSALIPLGSTCTACMDTSHLQNAYIRAIHADQVWNTSPYLQGQGIGVAVVDSGIAPHADFLNGLQSRIAASVKFNSLVTSLADGYGHGTSVAGIIGGNGTMSSGGYIGVAPKVNLVNVRVSSDAGATSTSDVVSALQWVLIHKTTYNIRVVNLSLNSSVAESYNVDPLDAACEILWNNQIVVVVSGGNNGGTNNGILYPPANDPFVISVGATTGGTGTASTSGDTLAPYSAYGRTSDGFAKPDLVAPGTNIISTLASSSATMVLSHPDHLVLNPSYFRMSGTSMAAPVVSGAVALLLQSNPTLTPDQVKYRLKATAHPFGPGAGAGYLDIYAAVHSTVTGSANTGIPPSQVLTTGSQPVTWTTWNAANWSSANWSSANWSSANWSSDYWGS
jgi:serine protease AprX